MVTVDPNEDISYNKASIISGKSIKIKDAIQSSRTISGAGIDAEKLKV